MQILKADDVFNLEEVHQSSPYYFLILQEGHNYGSDIYVKKKIEAISKYTEVQPVLVYSDELTIAMLNVVKMAAKDDYCIGIMPQLPITAADEIINAIPPEKDVDGLRPDSKFVPATVRGVLEYLRYINCGKQDLDGAKVLVIGRSREVGKPLANILSNKDWNGTVTIAHSKTKNLQEIIDSSDIIVSAVGKPHFIKKVPQDSICIDVGISKDENGKTAGDFDPSVNAKYLTPVPGGCGPMTIKCLCQNIHDVLLSKHL